MVSLFDVDIYRGRLDPRDLDVDSWDVYFDPDFSYFLEITDHEVIGAVSSRLDNRRSLVVDRLAAMLFLLNTPQSCRVLVHADFNSIRSLLFISWRESTSWVPSDMYLKNVITNRSFRALMFLDDGELALEIEDLGVDPSTMSKFAAVLLLLNTTSSWTLLGSTDVSSIIVVSRSSYATERRVRTLKNELDRLERYDVIGLIEESGEQRYLPIEIVREIVLSTHDIGALTDMQKVSSVYAQVLSDPEVLQQLATWWINNGEPIRVEHMTYRPFPGPFNTFKEFRQWVIDNFKTRFCYESHWVTIRRGCFRNMIRDNDVELWENIKKNVDLREMVRAVEEADEEYIINGRGPIEDLNFVLMSYVAFGTAEDLMNAILIVEEGLAENLWGYLLVRRDYNRDIAGILLEQLIRTPVNLRSVDNIDKRYVFEGPTSSRWIPELIRDLEDGYYPSVYQVSVEIPTDGQTDRTSPSRVVTLSDYLRDLLWGEKRGHYETR